MQLWPANEKRVLGRCRGGGFDVGVRFDDQRRRVAELEVDPLLRRSLAQLPADAARARERDRLHPLVLDQRVTDLGGGPDDDVEPARRQPGLVLELGQEKRREGRLARRLEDDRAAGGQRGRDLVGDEVEREVERADRPDDADRRAEREGELAFAGLSRVHRDHVAGELPRLDGRERVRGHGPRGFDLGRLQRLARLVGDQACDLFVASAERSRDADEDLSALVRRERLPHRLLGGVDRAARLVRARLRDPPDDLA